MNQYTNPVGSTLSPPGGRSENYTHVMDRELHHDQFLSAKLGEFSKYEHCTVVLDKIHTGLLLASTANIPK